MKRFLPLLLIASTLLAVACRPVSPSTPAVSTEAIPPTAEPAETADLPLLPPLTSFMFGDDDFPTNLTWALDTILPDSPAAVAIYSQPAEVQPLSVEEAAVLAKQYRFENGLYVEAGWLSPEEAIASGFLVALDGSRSLSFSGRPYSYSDVTNWEQGADLLFAQAAPIAEQFLKENGWLEFPYVLAESNMGQGVLFWPVLEGITAQIPAYGVRVAGNGRVAQLWIYPLDDLTAGQTYPIITAEAAWAQLQANPNQIGTLFQILLPESESPAALPQLHVNRPAVGETGDFYTNISAYRPLNNDTPIIVRSLNFFNINADPAVLEELAEQTNYVLHLWGIVQEEPSGMLSLALTDWEVIKEAGGVPMFFGLIERQDSDVFLVDEANRQTHLLPDAPAALKTGDNVSVTGMPKGDSLIWQTIAVYPPQEEIAVYELDPMTALTVESVELVYSLLPGPAYGLSDNLLLPVWQFTGTADNGSTVTLWVTAVTPSYIQQP